MTYKPSLNPGTDDGICSGQYEWKEYHTMHVAVIEPEIIDGEREYSELSLVCKFQPGGGGSWWRGQQASYFGNVWIILFRGPAQSWRGGKIQE